MSSPANEGGVKALSIRQPWAWLILNGFKDVENRDWRTSYRGEFLIHTGQKAHQREFRHAAHLAARLSIVLPAPAELPYGGIVGTAVLTACVTRHPSPWFTGRYGFVLTAVRETPFVACPGQRRFFTVGEAVLERLQGRG
jgi:hypothetical protein